MVTGVYYSELRDKIVTVTLQDGDESVSVTGVSDDGEKIATVRKPKARIISQLAALEYYLIGTL